MGKDLPGDGLGVFPSVVLDIQIDPGVVEENPGEPDLVVLETEEEGGVPGLVPRVPVHVGFLGEQLDTTQTVPKPLRAPHSQPRAV